MGILDQDVTDKISLAVPQLYRRGIERKEWTQTKFWLYMVDGLYQSVICFYFTYLIFLPANFNTGSGRLVNDYKRMGIYIANPTVFVVNTYILLNTYRWDWVMVLVTSISILLVWFWTGVYSSFTAGFTIYRAAQEVFGALTFWCTALLTITLCLLPRFAVKSFQKIYMPYDVDIVREQIRQGKFDYLKDLDPAKVNPTATEKVAMDSASSSECSKPMQKHNANMSEDMRPISPPSVAPTATTGHISRSQNGSDGTDYTGHRSSIDRAFPPVNGIGYGATPTITADDLDGPRPSFDRPRPSFDRLRSSMDRTRPSFEASNDFTSAAYLARVESSNNAIHHTRSRTQDITNELRPE